MTRAYDNAVDARYPSGRRNLIINGAMQVAQRGTSVTGQTANGYYTLDRWRQVASGATLDSSQQTLTLGQSDIPSQFRYFQRFNVTSGGDNCGPQTRIEDVNQFDGTQVTLSFYAKGTNPGGGHITVLFDQVFGSGGSTTVSLSEDVTLTSSWQRFTVTKTLGSLSGKTVGTSSYLNVKFNQPSDDNTTDAWSIDFTGVQLEYGNVATPFEHRSYGEELALCQRYAVVLGGNSAYERMGYGVAYDTDRATIVFPIQTEMRVPPSFSYSGSIGLYNGASIQAINGVEGNQNSTKTPCNGYTTSGSVTQSNYYFLTASNDINARVTLDAEL